MENKVLLMKLRKEYDGKNVIKDLDMEIEDGEIISVIGPSGTGKSTLLKCIAGLEPLTDGEVIVENENVTNLSANKRPIVMMFQQPHLFPHMSVYENIMFGLTFTSLKKEDKKQAVHDMLQRVGLISYEHHYPYELSGGQQQRVALARAIVTKPKLLLLDEPFSSLDNELRQELRLWVKSLLKEQRVTALFVTHDLDEAIEMGDRIAVFAKGCLQQIGNPLEVYYHPRNSFVAEFFSDGLMVDRTQFVHSEHLQLDSKPPEDSSLYWKGKVLHSSVKYGMPVYRIEFHHMKKSLMLQCVKKLETNQTVFVSVKKGAGMIDFTKG
ncbi:ABC transporter ATP-binding protein [Bacillus timonensis]|nr:ABC transporter ATP-binding protein [Bacillus timonensis]